MNKKILFSVLCLTIVVSGAVDAYEGSFPASTSDFTDTRLTISGQNRDIIIYRPTAAASPPLLILLSGTGSDLNSNMLNDFGREYMKEFADTEGLAIAVPMQRIMTWGDWDNHFEGTPYWETATANGTISSDPYVNPDLMLLNAIMDEAIKTYGVDQNRIYLIGFSNGAFFSYFASAVLSNRVAAFAESGGGLVLSNTTAGEPPCSPVHLTGIPSESLRSCTNLGWTPQTCVSVGAIPRPVDPKGRKIPPGFLSANDNDDTVPFAHTCNLVYALTGITEISSEIFHFEKSPSEEGGHVPTNGYLTNAWNFMKNKRLSGMPSNCALSSKTDMPDVIYVLQCISGIRQCTCQAGLETVINMLRVLAGL